MVQVGKVVQVGRVVQVDRVTQVGRVVQVGRVHDVQYPYQSVAISSIFPSFQLSKNISNFQFLPCQSFVKFSKVDVERQGRSVPRVATGFNLVNLM